MAPRDSQIPDPEVIRQKAQEVIQRPDYNLEPTSDNAFWLIKKIIDFIEWILAPLRGLFAALYDISPIMAWLFIIGLVFILVALVTHIVYSFKVALGRRQSAGYSIPRGSEPVVDPETLELQADEAMAAGDCIGAVRLLFRACLVRLERGEERRFRLGMTNREHLRRYRNSPIFDSLRLFVETIDRKWYGTGVCVVDDFEVCARAHANIREMAGELPHAERA